MSTQYNKTQAKLGKTPEPTFLKSASDFKEFSKAIEHVGGVLLPAWRSTIRMGGHIFKKMKQEGEKTGERVPEVEYMEAWAMERQKTAKNYADASSLKVGPPRSKSKRPLHPHKTLHPLHPKIPTTTNT